MAYHHHHLEPHRDKDRHRQHAVHRRARSCQHAGHGPECHQQDRHGDAAHCHEAIAQHQCAQRHDRRIIEPHLHRCAGPAGDAPEAAERGGEQAQLPQRVDRLARFLGSGRRGERARHAGQRQRAQHENGSGQSVGNQRPRARAGAQDDHRQAENETDEQKPGLAAHVAGGKQGEVVAQVHGYVRPEKTVADAFPTHASLLCIIC